MSEPIKNRYEFVILFDVENKFIAVFDRTQAICLAWTPKPAMGW